MHQKDITTRGSALHQAKKALILLHGRGASADDILALAGHLHTNDYALLAPNATHNTWYPYSFLAPVQQNEPWLTGALQLIDNVVKDINAAGIDDEHIYFTGFSQGACLTLEYVTRHARRWGGVAAFTGGLIGEKINRDVYQGDFEKTPVFIGTSDPDPHVPVERVYASVNILRSMGAEVTEKVYTNMGHTIIADEVENANRLIFT